MLSIKNIDVSVDNKKVLNNFSLDIDDGSIHVIMGPNGVGKSSLLNRLVPDLELKTGVISNVLGRGKHTTRHSELIAIAEDTYIFDTPGFSSLYVTDMVLML